MEKKNLILEETAIKRKKIVKYNEFQDIIKNLTDYEFYGMAANLGIIPKEKSSIEKVSKEREKLEKDLINIYVALGRNSRRDILHFAGKLNKIHNKINTNGNSDSMNGEEKLKYVVYKEELDLDSFVEARSKFLVDGHMPFCKDCLVKRFRRNSEEQSFNMANKLCQFIDIPFIPNNWISLYQTNKERTFELYAQLFNKEDYETIDWSNYNTKYLELRADHKLDEEFNFLKDEERKQLILKWGSEYSDEEIVYLEQLYSGLLQTQNVNGSLQVDQAKKLCKISLIIDSRIREEADFDKLLASYDKLVKIAEFTPKNAKNAGDFDSAGEIFAFLEKRGWVNQFYDNAVRDEVDNTMKSIQNWLRNFYINETGIPEDITNRIEGLKIARELENQNNLYVDEEMTPEEFDDYEKELFNIDKFEEELT